MDYFEKEDDFTILAECPHCHGKLKLGITNKVSGEKTIRERTGGPKNAELTIMCVTRGGEDVWSNLRTMRNIADDLGAYFLVVMDTKDGNDNVMAFQQENIAHLVGMTTSKGYVESILTTAYSMTDTTWVLRLDDDELPSSGLQDWIKSGKYKEHTKWSIPTMALWPDNNHFIYDSPLWPDPHLRLTTWRNHPDIKDVHQGMDFAPVAPFAIVHYKYIKKSTAQRKLLAEHYEKIKEGAGHGKHMPFTLPENYFPEGVTVAPILQGKVCDDLREDLLFCNWEGEFFGLDDMGDRK